MKLSLTRKRTGALYPTDILFQTPFWGRVKTRLGWSASAFELSLPGKGDVLVLTRPVDDERSLAYVPHGPEHGPAAPEEYGLFLEALSGAISQHLDPSAIVIRYDLPWPDPYALDDTGSPIPHDLHRPAGRLRELRMNYSTTSWNLRKAPCDLTVADSLVVDLSGTEQEILDRMKPKTRYNIHLSSRKGVRVVEVDSSSLPEFYDLYLQTARRGRFSALDYAYFSALFEARSPLSISTRLSFYLGVHGREVLAGAVVAVSGRRATYLFGASSNHSRNLMSPYAVHWRAIQDARSRQCIWYDMGGVSPYRDPTHRLHGLFRFKAGFGGHIEHRAGTWDYPLQRERYEELRNGEALRSTF